MQMEQLLDLAKLRNWFDFIMERDFNATLTARNSLMKPASVLLVVSVLGLAGAT